MRESRNHPSLLSYLLPKNRNFCLRLQSKDSEKSPDISSLSPFILLENDDPLAHTIRGAFVTDLGSIIKEVNFLIQRDTVLWPPESETSLTNSIIDHFWQQAMHTINNRTSEHSMLLGAQVGEQQQLLAFAPLFYCRKQQVYLEPPCPKCGKILQLCTNDTLLNAAGLTPYATSLRRYLFCPSCIDNSQIFYTLKKEATDPATVLDCKQLIRAFGKLTPATQQGDIFPCLDCQQYKHCYGDLQEVVDALYTLSFYPFYLLITERDSLDGFHMLTLLYENKATLAQKPTQASASPSSPSNNKAISTILGKISDSWQKEANEQTITDLHLSSQETSPPNNYSPNEAPVIPTSVEAYSSTLPEGYGDNSDDLSQETIIIKNPANSIPQRDNTLHTETILVSSNSAANEQHQGIQSSKDTHLPDNKTSTEDTDLAETIILRPGKKP